MSSCERYNIAPFIFIWSDYVPCGSAQQGTIIEKNALIGSTPCPARGQLLWSQRSCDLHFGFELAICRRRLPATHVDLAGDGGGDEGGAALLQKFTGFVGS